LTVAGTALWWRTPAPTPSAPPPTSPSASGFAANRSTPTPPPPATARPFIGTEAPLAFRFGAGYLGGFLVGWVWRKSVKLALSLGGTALAAVAMAKYAGVGVGEADWQALQTGVTQGLGWLQQQALTLRDWLSGYLPSGVASVLGLWRGARWK
jgi:uncharacterized membrane protein (Fun14 family)